MNRPACPECGRSAGQTHRLGCRRAKLGRIVPHPASFPPDPLPFTPATPSSKPSNKSNTPMPPLLEFKFYATTPEGGLVENPEGDIGMVVPKQTQETVLLARPRPWQGQLWHDRRPSADWGMIRDETGELVALVRSRRTEEEEHHCRREGLDPTQARVDFILAACNAPAAGLENREAQVLAELRDLAAELAAEKTARENDVAELNTRLEDRAKSYLWAARRDVQRLIELEVENTALKRQIEQLTPAKP